MRCINREQLQECVTHKPLNNERIDGACTHRTCGHSDTYIAMHGQPHAKLRHCTSRLYPHTGRRHKCTYPDCMISFEVCLMEAVPVYHCLRTWPEWLSTALGLPDPKWALPGLPQGTMQDQSLRDPSCNIRAGRCEHSIAICASIVS